MMSFQTLYTRATTLVSDSDTATQTLMQALINEGYHEVLAHWDWWFTYKSYADMTTTADTQTYRFPFDMDKIKSMTITSGSVAYPVDEVADEDFWNQLNARSANFTSDIPQFFFLRRDEIQIYPTPSTTGRVITFYYKRTQKDMTADDYTTGTITTLTNGARAVTGSGTTWTAPMVGRYFRINADGYWYEIQTFTSTTAITIRRDFEGTSIAAGTSAYTIGEMPLLPEGFHDMLVWYAVAQYYLQRKEMQLFNVYDSRYQRKLQKLVETEGNDSSSAVLRGMDNLKKDVILRDPNAYPLNLTS
jgi:hypothetical protein